jgi:hypothetical protein
MPEPVPCVESGHGLHDLRDRRIEGPAVHALAARTAVLILLKDRSISNNAGGPALAEYRAPCAPTHCPALAAVRPECLTMLVNRGSLPKSREKDIRTALRKLADVYGQEVDDLDLAAIETTYADTLRSYFAHGSASAYTQRNTRQNLTQLYRLLHETGVLKAPTHGTLKRTCFR